MAKSYHWKQIRHVLLGLGFIEIIPADDQVLFYQHPERNLIKLRKYDVDTIQIQVMCENNNLDFNEFIILLEKDKKHEN